MKTYNLKMTEAQLKAMIECVNTVSARFEECDTSRREVALVDKMLKANGFKRNFK